MPILDVDKASSVIVLKRSMSSGFAGVDNPLFYDPKTSMLFGDAKASVGEVLAEVKSSSSDRDGYAGVTNRARARRSVPGMSRTLASSS